MQETSGVKIWRHVLGDKEVVLGTCSWRDHRHKSPLTRNQNKPLNQPFPPGQKPKGIRNITLKPGKRRPQVEQVREKKKSIKKKQAFIQRIDKHMVHRHTKDAQHL